MSLLVIIHIGIIGGLLSLLIISDFLVYSKIFITKRGLAREFIVSRYQGIRPKELLFDMYKLVVGSLLSFGLWYMLIMAVDQVVIRLLLLSVPVGMGFIILATPTEKLSGITEPSYFRRHGGPVRLRGYILIWESGSVLGFTYPLLLKSIKYSFLTLPVSIVIAVFDSMV